MGWQHCERTPEDGRRCVGVATTNKPRPPDGGGQHCVRAHQPPDDDNPWSPDAQSRVQHRSHHHGIRHRPWSPEGDDHTEV